MNNINDQIVRYLDRQLSEEERIEFEKRLLFDEALKKAYADFQQVNELISEAKTPGGDKDYFINIVPRFRQSLNNNIKTSPFKKVSYGFVTFIMFICTFYIFNNTGVITNPDINSFESITAGLSDEQFNEARNYLTDNTLVTPSEDLVYQFVNEDDFDLEGILQSVPSEEEINILSDYQINNIESFAGEEELQQAYEELLTKSIL